MSNACSTVPCPLRTLLSHGCKLLPLRWLAVSDCAPDALRRFVPCPLRWFRLYLSWPSPGWPENTVLLAHAACLALAASAFVALVGLTGGLLETSGEKISYRVRGCSVLWETHPILSLLHATE